MTTNAVLIVGTITDGFYFVGPFDAPADAVAFAERVYADDLQWSVTELEPPAKVETDMLD